MKNIDLVKISFILSQKLNRPTEVIGIEEAGSGYHSDGFKLTTKDGQNFFLKRVKSYDLGFEFPERKVASLLVSNGMGSRYDFGPKPMGVILENKDEIAMLPHVDEDTLIYNLRNLNQRE